MGVWICGWCVVYSGAGDPDNNSGHLNCVDRRRNVLLTTVVGVWMLRDDEGPVVWKPVEQSISFASHGACRSRQSH